MTDHDRLLERVRAGDSDAFRELFRTHRAAVARLVHRMVGRTADHDDLIQETFLQVHRSLHNFRGQARFTTWLYRVTVNVVLMYRRAAKSRPVLVEQPESMVAEAPSMLPDEETSRRQRIDAFRRVLDRLSEKKRTVFVLHELEGLPAGEIAAIVEAPVLTVRTRLFYARREVQAMLSDEPALATLVEDVEPRVSPTPASEDAE